MIKILKEVEKDWTFEELIKTGVTEENFSIATKAIFTEMDNCPPTKPDYWSGEDSANVFKEEMSKYWFTSQGLYRQSDHWGEGIGSNTWYIEGYSKNNVNKWREGLKCGFCKWGDFERIILYNKYYPNGFIPAGRGWIVNQKDKEIYDD